MHSTPVPLPAQSLDSQAPSRALSIEEEEVLARLYVDPTTKSPTDTVIVYVIEDGTPDQDRPRWAFSVYATDLADSHASPPRAGAHPYAAVTLAHAPDSIKYERPDRDFACGRLGAPLAAVGDWMDWCDAVWADIQLGFDDDPNGEGHEEPDDGVLDSSVYLATMMETWRYVDEDAARIADLPTDEEDDAAAAAQAVRVEAAAP